MNVNATLTSQHTTPPQLDLNRKKNILTDDQIIKCKSEIDKKNNQHTLFKCIANWLGTSSVIFTCVAIAFTVINPIYATIFIGTALTFITGAILRYIAREAKQNKVKHAGKLTQHKEAKNELVALQLAQAKKQAELCAKITERDADGRTKIHLASMKKDGIELKELLEDYRCLDFKDNTGRTALDLAWKEGNTENVILLIEHGASLSGNIEKQSVLHEAAQMGKARVIDAFLNSYRGLGDFTIDDQDDNGFTPAHCAAKRGCLSVIELLFDREKLPTTTTNEGKSVFQLAQENSHQDIVNYLTNKGITT